MNFQAVSRYKDIIWYRTLACLKAESRDYYLGYLWFFLEPLIFSMTLYLIFGVLMGNCGSDFFIHLIIGLVVWQWFDAGINEGMMGIKHKLHITSQVSIPKYIFPVVHVLLTTIKFIFSLSMTLLVCAFFGVKLGVNLLYLIPLLITQFVVIWGISLPLALVAAYSSDMTLVVRSALRMLFYLSGVFYYLKDIPQEFQMLILINPAACLIECFRQVIIGHAAPSAVMIVYSLCVGLLVGMLGLRLCIYFDKKILRSVHV